LFLYRGGKIQDLGVLKGTATIGMAINNADQIVGEGSTFGQEQMHAIIYDNGKITDLNDLVNTPYWILSVATGINNAGQIVGTGITSGNVKHGFLLTPISGAAPDSSHTVGASTQP
jgi:probable HAF family extracellular repeat protein